MDWIFSEKETGKVQTAASLRGFDAADDRTAMEMAALVNCFLWVLGFGGMFTTQKIERARVLIVMERTSEERDYPRNRKFDWGISIPR